MPLSQTETVLLYHTKNYQGTTTFSLICFISSWLYHTKNYQGTTTQQSLLLPWSSLYHTKNYQGTTTGAAGVSAEGRLYHTKNYQGTTTVNRQCLGDIPSFVWDFLIQALFRLSDSFQLFCGISVLSPNFGWATSSNFCVGFPPSKQKVRKKSGILFGHQILF